MWNIWNVEIVASRGVGEGVGYAKYWQFKKGRGTYNLKRENMVYSFLHKWILRDKSEIEFRVWWIQEMSISFCLYISVKTQKIRNISKFLEFDFTCVHQISERRPDEIF